MQCFPHLGEAAEPSSLPTYAVVDRRPRQPADRTLSGLGASSRAGTAIAGQLNILVTGGFQDGT